MVIQEGHEGGGLELRWHTSIDGEMERWIVHEPGCMAHERGGYGWYQREKRVFTRLAKTGRNIEVVAMLDMTSVTVATRKLTERAMAAFGSDWRWSSCWPSHSLRPDTCRREGTAGDRYGHS